MGRTFGRSSLEAGSRGNAVILSKRGGLPETISNPIFLAKCYTKSIFSELENLIKNKNLLRRIQLESFKILLHLISKNIQIIDKHRKNAILSK